MGDRFPRKLVAILYAARDQVALGIIYVIDAGHMQIPTEMRKMGEVEHIIEPMPRMVIDFEEAPVNLVNTMAQNSVDSEKAMLQYADFLVEQARMSAQEYGAQDVDVRIVLGSPADEVVAFARDRKADLIVFGRRGFGRLKSLLLGSTSTRLPNWPNAVV